MLQYGPILAALNTTNANKRIRIFHTRVKLRYKTTQDVASYSIVTIQLLVVCLTVLVRWPKTVTAKRKRLAQKEQPHRAAKRKQLAARRKTSWQKEKDSKQKENLTAKRITSPCSKKKTTCGNTKNLTAKRKRLTAKRITSPCGKKKTTHGKKKNLTTKRKRLTAKFLRYREDIVNSYFFCSEVILFAVRFFFLP